MRYSRFYKCLLLASVSVFSCSTKVEAGRFDDFIDWVSGRTTIKVAHPTSPKKPKNSQKFNEAGRTLIEKLPFSDTDVQNGSLEGERFIINQDADHPDSLRSLSLFDQERQLQYIKEEGIGKRGKKILYFDPQADAPYWKKNGEWYVTAPYIFGYSKEKYSTREALEKRLDALFQARVLKYKSSSCKILSRAPEGVILQAGAETTFASNTHDMHRFYLKHDLKSYAAYLYEGEETPSLLKSLGLLAMIVGAEVVDGINVQKLIPSRDVEDQAVESEGEMSFGEMAFMATTAFTAPKLLPIYLLLRASRSLGAQAAFQQKDMNCKDGICSDAGSFSENSSHTGIASLKDLQFCEDLMKNLTKPQNAIKNDYLEWSKVPCVDNVVYLLGNTRVGKGVFSNYLAGRNITVKKNGMDFEVNVANPISAVGHGVGSNTSIPILWKSHDFCFYDTPGLGDTRGPDHDIVKSYYLQHLGNAAKSLRLVLVAEEGSLPAAATGFLNLVRTFEKLVGKQGVTQLQDATTLIITKYSGLYTMDEIFTQIKKIKDNSESHLSSEMTAFLTHLIKGKRIYPFERITSNNIGNLQRSPQDYINIIKGTTVVPSKGWVTTTEKPTFNTVVSAETGESISKCSQYLNDKLKDTVENIARIFEKHYASVIATQPLNATSVQDWHTFFDTTRKTKMDKVETPYDLFGILSSVSQTLHVTDFPDRNITLHLDTLKTSQKYLDIFKSIPSISVQMTPMHWVSGMNSLIAHLDQLAKIHTNKTDIKTEGKYLVVKGYFPKMTEFFPGTDTRVYGLHTFWLDQKLTVPGGHFSVIAPHWTAPHISQITIDLNGRPGSNYSQAISGRDRTGENGSDGVPGNPGQSGGRFFALGDRFFGFKVENLKTITSVNGGRGGDGQHGGHGGDGVEGGDATIEDVKQRGKFQWSGEEKYWNTHLSVHYKGYLADGGVGSAGGVGGKGGSSGTGGHCGTIDINGVLTQGSNGAVGTNGAKGNSGKGGYRGQSVSGIERVLTLTAAGQGLKDCAEDKNIFVSIFTLGIKDAACEIGWGMVKADIYRYEGWYSFDHIARYIYPDGIVASDDKVTLGKIVSQPSPALNYHEIINGYKIFLRENLAQLNQTVYKDNILIQAQKELLQSFLKSIEIKKK